MCAATILIAPSSLTRRLWEAFDRRRPDLANKQNDRITLGWIGSPGTAYNRQFDLDALEVLFARYPDLHLRLVGTGHNLELVPL